MKRIAVLAGSKSDLPKIAQGINLLRKEHLRENIDFFSVDVCSAHRNIEEHRARVEEYVDAGVDVIITPAGKFAALFGATDSLLRNELSRYYNDCDKIRVIAIPIKGKSEQSTLAALYGVLEVPDHQIVFRPEFMEDYTTAFEAAINEDLEPTELKEQKPAEFMTWQEGYEASRRVWPGIADHTEFIKEMEAGGLFHEYTGKVRETFSFDEFPNLLYFYQTNRISIFDIVLEALIEHKGAVLTATTIDKLTGLLAHIPNHLVAYGSGIDEYLPENLRGRTNLHTNMMVVKKTKPLKVEAIVRGYLTGSGKKDYDRTGMVCGIELPEGLIDGSELPDVIFTPSTKAELGDHDENITFEQAVEIVGQENAEKIRKLSIEMYCLAHQDMKEREMIIADTKFEFGIDEDGNLLLIDETLTPDSSRYWPVEGRLAAMEKGETPPSLDKQPIRNAGEEAGVKKDPTWIPPQEILEQATQNYRKIAAISFDGKSLEQFQKEKMGVSL